MRGWQVALGLLVLSCSGSVITGRRGGSNTDAGDASSTPGCAKDTDCKGNRICSAGRCMSPVDAGESAGRTGAGGARNTIPSGGATSSRGQDAGALGSGGTTGAG